MSTVSLVRKISISVVLLNPHALPRNFATKLVLDFKYINNFCFLATVACQEPKPILVVAFSQIITLKLAFKHRVSLILESAHN